MSHHLRCVDCGWEGPEESYVLACPRCGGLVEAVGLVLPEREPTPLVRSGALSERLGVEVWWKDETVNRTGTMKDREAWLTVRRFVWHNVPRAVMWSSGNAGSAVASEMAWGWESSLTLVVPEASRDRVEAYEHLFDGRVGVRYVNGGNDEAAREAARLGATNEGGFRNYARREGLTTIGRELIAYAVPFDWYVQAVTGGLGVMAIEKAYRDAGMACPRVLAVQPSLCAPMFAAWRAGADELEERFVPRSSPMSPYVRVLRTRRPEGYRWVKRAMDRVGGRFEIAAGREIRAALRLFYADGYWQRRHAEGITVGLEAATALAGLVYAVKQRHVEPGARVVVNVSGAAKGHDVDEEWIGDLL